MKKIAVTLLFLLAACATAAADDFFFDYSSPQVITQPGADSMILGADFPEFSIGDLLNVMKSEHDVALEKRQAILSEIDKLEDHPWAGSYTVWNGAAATEIVLAPQSGFVFRVLRPKSDFWYIGDCAEENGRVKLTYLPTADKDAALPHTLLPVRWGERLYLLERYDDPTRGDYLLAFCNGILRGDEPRHNQVGLFLLRDGDAEKPAAGLPGFPPGCEKYEAMLRDRLIDAKITAVGETEIEPAMHGDRIYHVSVTIDRGEDADLRPGTYPTSNIVRRGTLRLTNVEKTQSAGTLTFRLSGEEESPVKPEQRLVVVAGE